MPIAHITVAAPARAIQQSPFALQLRGPFDACALGGFLNRYRSLCRRFGAYSSSSRLLRLKLYHNGYTAPSS